MKPAPLHIRGRALGVGLAFSGIGLGAITAFFVILFAQNGWEQARLVFILLSAFFMLGQAASLAGIKLIHGVRTVSVLCSGAVAWRLARVRRGSGKK